MEQVAVTSEGRTAAEAPATCDQTGCKSDAVFSYMWDWGQKGVCCAQHQFLLQQSSEPLQRRVNFAPLAAAAVAPITRDERAKLKGEVYAAEAEIVDLKARGSLLYSENTALTRQVQAKTVRLRETELQLEEANRELAALRDRVDREDAERGELVDELQRLRSLEKFTVGQGGVAAGGTTGSDFGLQGQGGGGGSVGGGGPPTSKSGGGKSK